MWVGRWRFWLVLVVYLIMGEISIEIYMYTRSSPRVYVSLKPTISVNIHCYSVSTLRLSMGDRNNISFPWRDVRRNQGTWMLMHRKMTDVQCRYPKLSISITQKTSRANEVVLPSFDLVLLKRLQDLSREKNPKSYRSLLATIFYS